MQLMDAPDVLLTHRGRVTHICVIKLIIIGSDNGLSPGRHQAIIWTNAGILLIGPLGTNFNEISIEIHTSSFKKMHLKMSGKCRPFCFGLNVVIIKWIWYVYSCLHFCFNIPIYVPCIFIITIITRESAYNIPQEICTRFCCALLCCGYAIVHNEFTWSIYPYSSGLLCWHWGNR